MNNQNESRGMNNLRTNWTLSLVWLVSLACPTTALTQDNFYKGKTIRFVVAYEPGGASTFILVPSRATSASISPATPRPWLKI